MAVQPKKRGRSGGGLLTLRTGSLYTFWKPHSIREDAPELGRGDAPLPGKRRGPPRLPGASLFCARSSAASVALLAPLQRVSPGPVRPLSMA
jgi:hypothetical protein